MCEGLLRNGGSGVHYGRVVERGMSGVKIGSSEGPWCSKVSNHRPIICSFAGPTLLISADMAHGAVSAKPRVVKKHLQTDPLMLGNYQDSLITSLAGLSTPTKQLIKL